MTRLKTSDEELQQKLDGLWQDDPVHPGEQGYANLQASLKKLATEEAAKNRTAGPKLLASPKDIYPDWKAKPPRDPRPSLPGKRMEWRGNT
jgi:hypothetical protein